MLSQKDDSKSKKQVIYYLSKKFTKRESRYNTVKKTYCALM
jgi:hypothetical protein